ncbi:MAG: hypothetical protein ACSLEX_00065 [Minisyncoccota bacterium]
MGYEDSFAKIDRGIDQKLQQAEYLHPIIAEADKKAKQIIHRDAIDPITFTPPYDRMVVHNDIILAEKLRAKFETDEPHKKYADVLEGLLYEHIEQSDWFGGTASTIKTSLYDDYVNGVDLIVEFEEPSRALSHMGLAIDVTFSAISLRKKFDMIHREIVNGTLTEVKYFESERSQHKGLYQKLPRVVVGIERSRIIELATLWLDPKRKKEFAVHPVQKIILEEIALQLTHFQAFAETSNVKARALTPIFARELSVIKNILAEKRGMPSGDSKNDRVFTAIKQQLT